MSQLSKAELYYYNQYASSYFEYIREDNCTGRESCLSRIFGLYHIETTSRSLRMDVVIMNNAFYEQKPEEIFDLKGSLRRQNKNMQKSQSNEEDKKLAGEPNRNESSIIPVRGCSPKTQSPQSGFSDIQHSMHMPMKCICVIAIAA